MTSIGQILTAFFSPNSTERLWVMREDDPYTQIVRAWSPVITRVRQSKEHLVNNSASWAQDYTTDPNWRPSMTDRQPDGTFRLYARSPEGTDAETCFENAIPYVLSRLGDPLDLWPEIETHALHTGAIGSFSIYATADSIDFAEKSATLSFLVHNTMTRRSFGAFAETADAAGCGMETQYMWWSWKESVEWESNINLTPDLHKITPITKFRFDDGAPE